MNKVSGDDRIPAELLQILKDDAVKVLHSVCQQIWKTQQRPRDWIMSVFIPIPKKGNAKECSNYHIVELISDACKVTFKFFHARPQQHGLCIKKKKKSCCDINDILEKAKELTR